MDAATPFAHASEAEMARILDFYAVRWEYEPDTFPILWNLDGGVVESFSPDFYLPDLELYLEMTTLRQKLVRKKNRKLRRLRELYPAIHIKLFYARDFRELMLKYGKGALVAGLSGTSGQVSDPYGSRLVPQAGTPRSDIGVRGLLTPVPLGPVRSMSPTSRRRARRAAASADLAASAGDSSVPA
ncbi:MAG: hypothetical protein ABIP77_02365 [Candidatus Limnocylindrales bacterium]